MIELRCYFPRPKAVLAALFVLAGFFCPAAHGADKDKKEEKEKPEKVLPWVEIRTAHFVVASDGGEKTARRVADQFERLLGVFESTMPNCRVSTGMPVRILAARDGQSFARVVPEFPYDTRHEQPPGLFVSNSEKTYIALRANAAGRFAYADIYEQYAHQVLKLSYRNLPPWLEEGYSTVYNNLVFTDRGVRLERPDPADLSVLFESPLLPLDLVLRQDRTSPYYSPGNKDSVYFAESRVFVHFLISDPQFSGSKALNEYVTAIEGGADPFQSARQAFGDLNQLQTKLDAFVRAVHPLPTDLPVTGGADSGASRMLTAAQSSARIADFLALRGRAEDAQDRLEEALRTDPSLAEAEQSLGFILLKKNDLDEAEKHFQQAAQLDPKDGLTYYGLGSLAVARAGSGGVSDSAVEAFEKTVALNPDFAPAWYNLASLYSQRNETLQKALTDMQRAASLVPGEARYQLELAALLGRLGRTEEARKIAGHVRETARERGDANKAGDLIARIGPPQPSGAPASAAPASTGNAPAKAPSDSGPPRIANKTEAEQKPAPAATYPAAAPPPAPKPEAPAAPVPPLFSEAQVYSMVGTISDVNCSNAPQVLITLKSWTIVMKLHAEDLAKIFTKSAASAPAAKGPSCSSLRGRTARVSYLFVTGKAWDAEIQTVEFRSQP